MKFDCIIMNPPYNRGLHIKILDEAIKHLSAIGKIISLQPIDKWQKAILFQSDLPINNTYIIDKISADDSSKIFNIGIHNSLGIISNLKNTSIKVIDNIELLYKMYKKLITAISIGNLLNTKLEKIDKALPIMFAYGVEIGSQGRLTPACYRIVSTDKNKAYRTGFIGHSRRYNANSNIERDFIWHFYNNLILRFIYKEFGFGGIPYKIIPFVTGFIDENGKTPLDEEWTFEKLAKWFELDYNDLVIIRKSLDKCLHPEEQKVIEETMEKYK